jgi:hypothetical protein
MGLSAGGGNMVKKDVDENTGNSPGEGDSRGKELSA